MSAKTFGLPVYPANIKRALDEAKLVRHHKARMNATSGREAGHKNIPDKTGHFEREV